MFKLYWVDLKTNTIMRQYPELPARVVKGRVLVSCQSINDALGVARRTYSEDALKDMYKVV